jgi:hypothetical protein
MAENWAAVAADIGGAIAEVGFAVTLIEPGAETGPDYDPTPGAEIEHAVIAIADNIQRRDGNGTVTQTVQVLTIAATGVTPVKGWHVEARGQRHRIGAVYPLAPGEGYLLFDLELS